MIGEKRADKQMAGTTLMSQWIEQMSAAIYMFFFK